MDFDIYEFNYEDRIGNLKNEAQSKVKSEKHFPIFDIDGEKYIFKPLSKTKSFLTPFFAYSEVFWSNIINSYFDDKAPLYKLAICRLAKANYLRKIIKPKAVDTSQIFNNIKEDISFSVKILDNCLSKKI